jgi:hypothetical protein
MSTDNTQDDNNTDEYLELAFKYRNGLEKLYWLVQTNNRCECEFVPNWTKLMDQGIPHNSERLRKHNHICIFCKSEYIYAEAIGEELFAEQMSARIMAVLDENFEDPIAVMFEDENGVEQIHMMERKDADRLAQELDDNTDDDEWP